MSLMPKTSASTKSTTVRAVTYCRISMDRLEIGAGVERQRIDTDRLCEQRGWTIVERVVDNDRSASRYARRGREGWRRLLELLEQGEVDAIVAYDLDRITRRPDELAPLIIAAERGVTIVTVSGTVLDLSNGDGVFAARILLAVAEKETASLSRRQKTKLRHDAEAGRPHWTARPFGYQRDGTLIPAEAVWLRRMAKWLADDGLSATAVAVRLNNEGVMQASGCRWQSSTVKTLVMSPRNVAIRTYKGKEIGPAAWKPALDVETWQRACAALDARALGTRQGRRSMLTGMVWCGRPGCGMKMHRSGGNYACSRHEDLKNGCGQTVNGKMVDGVIADAVIEHLRESAAAVRPRPVCDDERDEVAQLTLELSELAAMFGQGEISLSEFRAARVPLAERLKSAENAAVRYDTSAALARIAGDHATLAERWPELDDDLRRRIVSTVITRVIINPPAPPNGIRRLPKHRVKPIWA